MRNQTSLSLLCCSLQSPLYTAGCSGGSGASSTDDSASFGVDDLSVTPGAVWKLNRPIDITFSTPIDFSTVNLNTINVSTIAGLPATGTFSLLSNGRTVRFQPRCPALPDASDAGLKPGGVEYILNVLGFNKDGVSVLSTSGEPLEVGRSVRFSTPEGEDSQERYLDTVSGPPAPRVRNRSGVAMDDPNATHLRLGDGSQVFFTWNGDAQEGSIELEGGVPLNLYSVEASGVTVVLHLNQPVDPASANISSRLIQFQYDANADPAFTDWQDIGTDVTLVANCTDTGSVVEVQPIGLLPQDSDIRLNLREGFADIVGDRTLLDASNFARATTQTTFDPGTENPGTVWTRSSRLSS